MAVRMSLRCAGSLPLAGLAFAASLLVSGSALAQEKTLRIAMTATDIPRTNGQPDQGFEGNRFTGIPLFDALTQWDLSSGDKPSVVIPRSRHGVECQSRLIWGARLSLFMGVTPVLFALMIGSTIGISAGYIGGWVNTILMRTIDIFFAFPSVLLAIALSGALGAGRRSASRSSIHWRCGRAFRH